MRDLFYRRRLCLFILVSSLWGCSAETGPYPLDQDLARESVQQAMQAWVDGKSPKDLKPGIVIGDPAWDKGNKLVSFQILQNEETTDGSNLHIRVIRKMDVGGKLVDSKVNYIVGTSPVITIFPQ